MVKHRDKKKAETVEKPVIARRPNGPTWQSVPKTHEDQHIPDFLVTDSHVAALLGMTEKGLSTR